MKLGLNTESAPARAKAACKRERMWDPLES